MTVEAIAGFVRGRIKEAQIALRQAEVDFSQWNKDRGVVIEILQERLRTLQEVLSFIEPRQGEYLTREEVAELLGMSSPTRVSYYVDRARSGIDPDPIPYEYRYEGGILRLAFPKEDLLQWWERRKKKGRGWGYRLPRGWVASRLSIPYSSGLNSWKLPLLFTSQSPFNPLFLRSKRSTCPAGILSRCRFNPLFLRSKPSTGGAISGSSDGFNPLFLRSKPI